MKKIGLISDVHGNYAALTAILKLFERENCDELIHAGDIVDIGPDSRECLELLLSLPNATLILGNHDRDLALNESAVRKFSHVPAEHKERVFNSIDEDLRKKVALFPLYAERQLGKSKVLFTHYAFKREPFDISVYPFMPLITNPCADHFDEMFSGLDFDAVFFGHKHEPCDILGSKLYVDVGSVGCHPDPAARGIVIEYDDENFTYRRVSVPYDMQSTRRKMEKNDRCGKELYDFYFLRLKS